jgi:hypothetical protein
MMYLPSNTDPMNLKNYLTKLAFYEKELKIEYRYLTAYTLLIVLFVFSSMLTTAYTDNKIATNIANLGTTLCLIFYQNSSNSVRLLYTETIYYLRKIKELTMDFKNTI